MSLAAVQWYRAFVTSRRRRMRAGVRPCVRRNGRSTTTAYASRRTTVCATKQAVDDDGVCEQAYDRVCDETGGQRRRRMRAGVRPCVQRNGRSTTTAYASRRTTVCNVTDNNGVCQQAFERLCDVSGGQRRRRSNGQ